MGLLRFVGIVCLLFLFSHFSFANEECSDTPSADIESMKDLKPMIDKIETSPFLVACKEPPGLLKGRPETGLLKRSVVEKDSRGNTTQALLNKVIQKVRARIEATKHQMKNIATCMNQATPECAELKKWVDVDLPQYVKEARYHLSLSQSQHEVKTWVGIASGSPNKDLDPLGGYKFEDWAPLTKSEEQTARKQLKEYMGEISASVKQSASRNEICKTCGKRASDEAMLAVRFQHYQTYHQMMSELPLLQYLKGPEASGAEVMQAFQKMQTDLAKESKQLDEYEKMLSQNPLPTDVLKVLNYSTQLEETLLEDDKACGLASSLVYTMSNREMGNAIAIGLPILAVSFLAAPAVLAVGGSAAIATGASIGVGAATGGGFALHSYSEFKDIRDRTLGHIYGDELGTDLGNLEAAKRRVTYDVVTLPVGFGLGSMAVRSLSVGSKSLSIAKKIGPLAE